MKVKQQNWEHCPFHFTQASLLKLTASSSCTDCKSSARVFFFFHFQAIRHNWVTSLEESYQILHSALLSARISSSSVSFDSEQTHIICDFDFSLKFEAKIHNTATYSEHIHYFWQSVLQQQSLNVSTFCNLSTWWFTVLAGEDAVPLLDSV